ncbi:MAG: triose-phosphate isomerase [Phycisphaerales bacterium]
MAAGRTPFIGGNWKMNGTRQTARALATAVSRGVAAMDAVVHVAVFPPFPYLVDVRDCISDGPLLLGAQDVYIEPEGAFTGEVSPAMLEDVGVTAVLAGHSERRHVLDENDALVAAKVKATLDQGLWSVLCVGELLEQREAGVTDQINRMQLHAALADIDKETARRQLVIAYEPVWAIGTGRTATPEDAQTAHAAIRAELVGIFSDEATQQIRIIYGGSVKPENAASLLAMPDVDGFLVGGASLDAEGFCRIVEGAA